MAIDEDIPALTFYDIRRMRENNKERFKKRSAHLKMLNKNTNEN